MDEEDLGSVSGGRRILRFALPSMLSMLFISSYTIVDGLFVANWLGSDSLAALNLTVPAFNILGAVAFMFSAGGSAFVANLMGRGRREDAASAFSQMVLTVFLISLVVAAVALVFADGIVELLGADETLKPLALEYWNVLVPFIPIIMMQFLVMGFLIVLRKPHVALIASVSNGCLNMLLDWAFMDLLGWGMAGASLASGLGSTTALLIASTVVFSRRSELPLRICRIRSSVILPTCTNGASEMASNLSGAITTFLFNIMMMRYVGPDGVSAITVMMYVEFLSLAAILGYSSGVAPIMSYDHGADDRERMAGLFGFSLRFVMVLSLAVFLLVEVFADQIVGLFVSGNETATEMAVFGARVYAVAFLFMGLNVYASSLFTSLSNGVLSAAISGVRSLLLLAPLIVILPMAFDVDAIWFAVPVTEVATFVLTMVALRRNASRYGYAHPSARFGNTM